MKVLHVGPGYPPSIGGRERVIYTLCETLNEMGIRCDVLCPNVNNSFEVDSSKGYKVFRVPKYFTFKSTPFSPHMIIFLSKLYKGYDIIHVHMPEPMSNLALFLVNPDKPVIVHWHMEIVRQRFLKHFYKPLLKWIFKKSYKIIVSSNKLKRGSEFSEIFEDKGVVIPLPFDERRWIKVRSDEEFRKKLKNLTKNRYTVLAVGRLVYYKGFDVLIKSFQYLPQNIALLIVGDGPLKKDLTKLINKLKLSDRVFLLGKLPDERLKVAYEESDLFMLPSTYKTEAFGLVQLDALFFGLPIVSTNLEASGICEVNLHNKTGICVEPRSVGDLVYAINYILNNKERYNFFSKNARNHIRNFDRFKIAERLVKIYRDAIKVKKVY